MADSSLARESLGRKCTFQERQFFNTLAEYCLLQEGVKTLTAKQLNSRVNYLSPSFQKSILLGKPIAFQDNKLALERLWPKLVEDEDCYYEIMAVCSLFDEGNHNPTDEEIQTRIKKLSHLYLRKTIFLNPLKKREIECLEQASFGRGSREAAIYLNISEVIVKKYRISACNKLRCYKIGEAIGFAFQLGYLPVPIKDPQPLFQSTECEEVENTAI